ncbi:hypothetical protein SERLA73DRAFT_159243 [Serpula lacrymans var. lacrymans S7.3]|uniref:Uncharacterized protein n=2 Tax=Serpula lacrymans var. lacrymans TaxID=341189 RepID=F8PQM1_SERL3|nr:uncharacterized protein SERLADRAFT_414193 [Serpula lacrymans var. lacrymans S7.9]EGO02269.1 hypothetical protein SERLA73DRAFT_159243 [Serpula lacrymans var. lacrymans S7.3]EGO28013.1 hypothetical protein SERLADRAFT_414193 [Serpula lacrymans var. lacrymans S7.9]
MAGVTSATFVNLVVGLMINWASIVVGFYSLYTIIINILPKYVIRDLENLLKETRGGCITTLEEGLFCGENNQGTYLQRLQEQEEEVSILVIRTYRANTLYKQFRELFGGLSWQIRRKYSEVRDLRDSITLAREEGKHLARSETRILSPLLLSTMRPRTFSPSPRSSMAHPVQQLHDLLASPSSRKSIILPYSPPMAVQSLALPQTPPECHKA